VKIVAVVGARPNFVKIAPLLAELRLYPEAEVTLVHTGQALRSPDVRVVLRQPGDPRA
jgi:UDP-N-acetylglucosamine 2-epimerase